MLPSTVLHFQLATPTPSKQNTPNNNRHYTPRIVFKGVNKKQLAHQEGGEERELYLKDDEGEQRHHTVETRHLTRQEEHPLNSAAKHVHRPLSQTRVNTNKKNTRQR